MGERGEARPEIIERDWRSAGAQRFHGACDAVPATAHEDLFGDLDHELPHRHGSPFQNPARALDQVALLEIGRGDVDRDMLEIQVVGSPLRHVGGDRGQHLGGGAMGDLRIAQRVLELAGGDDAAVVEAHPGQGLEADDFAGLEADDRLVIGDDALVAERAVDIAADPDALHHRAAQLPAEADIATAPGFLGMVEREVGILTQDDAVQPILTGKRPADGDARHDAVAVMVERDRDRCQRGRGEGAHVGRPFAIADEDGEFVAADPASQAIGERRAEPHADLGDQRVPGSMAERIVDPLEMVDVDQHQPVAAAGGAHLGNGAVELAAVRQSGQRVEIGKTVIAGADLVMLDRDGAEMDAGRDDLAFEFAGAARAREIEGEGADDAAVAGLDRGRPAGAQAERQGKAGIGRPKRIGGDVGDFDGLTAKHRGSAGADIGAGG